MANSVFFVPQALEIVTRGLTFRRVVALVLRLAAGMLGLAALMAWAAVWGLGRFFEGQAVLGLVLFQGLSAASAYAVVHTILYRANTILELSDGKFIVLPMVSVLLRMAGECVFWVFASLAVAGFFLSAFAGQYAAYVTNQIPFSTAMPGTTGAGLVGGLLSAGVGVLLGFAALIWSYWLAEATSVLSTVAMNSETIRGIMERCVGEVLAPVIEASARSTADPTPAAPAAKLTPTCKACGAAVVIADGRFCMTCGAAVP